MQYRNSFLALALAIGAVTAQEFDNNDVPQQCRSVCQAMVDAARTCDNTNDGDRQEVDCICNTNGASTQLPECAACIRQFDDDDDDQNGKSTRETFQTTYESLLTNLLQTSTKSSPPAASHQPLSTPPPRQAAPATAAPSPLPRPNR